MQRLISIVIALGLVLTLVLACPVWAQDMTEEPVFEKYIRFNVTGSATDSTKANYSASFNNQGRYSFELRSTDSQVELKANFSIKNDKMMGSTKYDMKGWWNTLEEQVGDTVLTSDEYRSVASGVHFTGREIVGSGLTKTMLDNSHISQYHKAQGKGGEATAAMAFFNRYVSEEAGGSPLGNVTTVQIQNRVSFSGDWNIRYSFADPIEEQEKMEWWGSICSGVTGWSMPRNGWIIP